MNEAEKIIETIMDKEKLATHAQVANFLGIAASTLHGLITRNSVKTIRKHLRFKNFEIDEKEEQPLTMADVKRHIQDQSRTKNLHDNVQKVLEFEAIQNPATSAYSDLFQILVGENKDAIFQILSDKLEVENVDDVEKMRFIEDFEVLIKHVVSPTAKLKMLERLKGKYK